MTSQERKVLRMALEAFKEINYDQAYSTEITAIKEALAQPEQIPPSAYSNTHQPEQEPVTKYCCHLCFNKSGQLFLDRMIVCPECGNKRCPKATHHELLCTNSNESNQAGSVYTTPPQRTWVGLTDEDYDLLSDRWWKPNESEQALIDWVIERLKEKNT